MLERSAIRLVSLTLLTLAAAVPIASAQPAPAPAPAGQPATPPAAPAQTQPPAAGAGAADAGQTDDTVAPPDAVDMEPAAGEDVVTGAEPSPEYAHDAAGGAAAPPPDAGAPAAAAEEPAEDPLHFSGYLQAELFHNDAGTESVDASGRSTNQDFFRVRRARLKVQYEQELWEFLFQIDATTSGFTLKNAEATLVIPWTDTIHTRLVAGLFEVPFGFDVAYSSSKRAFPERSLLSQRFFPGERDLGLQLRGDLADAMFVYQVAVVNGNPLGDGFFPGIDPNRFKDVAGRIGLHFEHLDFGVSTEVGEGFIAPASDDTTTTNVDESHAAVNFGRWLAGLDVRFQYDVPSLGTLDAYGEFAFGQNFDRTRGGYPTLGTAMNPDPIGPMMLTTNDPVRRRQLAWYLAAVQNLGDLFAAAARVEQFDPTFDGADDTITSLTLAALFTPTHGTRVTAAYQFFWEPGSIANNSLWLRAQVKF